MRHLCWIIRRTIFFACWTALPHPRPRLITVGELEAGGLEGCAPRIAPTSLLLSRQGSEKGTVTTTTDLIED